MPDSGGYNAGLSLGFHSEKHLDVVVRIFASSQFFHVGQKAAVDRATVDG